MPKFSGPGSEELGHRAMLLPAASNPDLLFPGVKVALTHPSGGYYPIEAAGYLGEAEPALHTLQMQIIVDPAKVSNDYIDLIVFQIDGQRNLAHLKPEKRDGKDVHRQKICIFREKKWFRPKPEESYVMVAALDKWGHIAVFTATLMIQRNHMFLVKQFVREHKAYLNGTGIVIPGFAGEHMKWKQLGNYAAVRFRAVQASLPDIKEYKAEEPDLSVIGEDQMLVTEFSTARRQLAAGRMKDGRIVRVHYTALIQDNPRIPKFIPQGCLLNIGKLVSVPPEAGSEFKWEAKEVTVVG